MPAPVQSGRCPRESISIFLFIYFPSRPWQAALTAGIHAIASNSSDPQSIDGWQVLIDHRPAMRQRFLHAGVGVGGSERVNTHFSYSLAMRQSRQDTRRTTAGEPERTLVREDSAKGVQRRRLSAIPHRYQRSMGRGRHTEVLLFTCLNGKIAAPAASIGIPTAKASTWKGGSLWLVKPLKPSNNI